MSTPSFTPLTRSVHGSLHLRQTFQKKANALNQPLLITFLTAGYPHPDVFVDLLLGMEAGGADVIEVGVPFTDPLADGKVIEESNNVALENGVNYPTTLSFIREARAKGLKAPVILMGYLNPFLAYDLPLAISHARLSGADGFILVDSPPEESVHFKQLCKQEGMSLVPLVAPSTGDERMKTLVEGADSFVYVVSKMGVTGASTTLAAGLEPLVARIRRITAATNNTNTSAIPLAVGFGVSTRQHFETIGSISEAVVIGSKIVLAVKAAAKGKEAEEVKRVCEELSGGVQGRMTRAVGDGTGSGAGEVNGVNKVPPTTEEVDVKSLGEATLDGAAGKIIPKVDGIADSGPNGSSVDANSSTSSTLSPARFGDFGGQYVPEALVGALHELERVHNDAVKDPEFWKEFEHHYPYINRPSVLYDADRMTREVGGAKIWFKREDLNHTGSHKINNAIGQILLARRLGKKRIIAETGAGQHGVATATVCAKFGLECVIYMGAEDVRRQALNVFRIKMLGGKVMSVASGSQTLKDAINEAMRDWVTNLSTTHYLVGSAIGPHPFPTVVRDFQSVIGKEIKQQMMETVGKLPDAVVACVGGGSNAIGTFYPFIDDKSVRLVGVEAAGDGLETNRHSATLSKGTVGVLHGVRTYVLQSREGQILGTHSISAGLDYPGVGPEHSWLKDVGRAEYRYATDEEALRGFKMCTEWEGIIPALETAHAVWGTVQIAKELPKDANIVMCLSGRGDKDVEQIADQLPKWAEKLDWKIAA